MLNNKNSKAVAMGRLHNNNTITKMNIRTSVYTDQELKQIEAILEKNKDFLTLTAIHLALQCGLRLHDICKLRNEDVHLIEGYLTIQGPRSGLHRVTLSEKTKASIASYLGSLEPQCAHEFLLSGESGLPLKASALSSRFRRVATSAHVSNASFQKLRRTMVHKLAEAGMSGFTLMSVGGWLLTKTMESYIQHN